MFPLSLFIPKLIFIAICLFFSPIFISWLAGIATITALIFAVYSYIIDSNKKNFLSDIIYENIIKEIQNHKKQLLDARDKNLIKEIKKAIDSEDYDAAFWSLSGLVTLLSTTMYDAALTSGMLYRAIDVNNKENFKKIFYYYEELLVVKNFPNIVSSFTNLTKDEKKLYTESFWNMVMSQEKSAITLIDQIEKDGF
jgi:hypothetical protein